MLYKLFKINKFGFLLYILIFILNKKKLIIKILILLIKGKANILHTFRNTAIGYFGFGIL